MKFTVIFITLLSISSSWGIKAKIEEPKDKREAGGTYIPSHVGSSHSYNSPALSQVDANAISIGAGYSVGGAKPSYSFSDQGSQAAYQIQPEGHPGSGHATIQLAPITLQPGQGGLVSNDLSQLMSQLSQQINSGAIAIPSSGSQGALYQFAGQGGHGAQEIALPQLNYGSPKLQQYSFGEQGQAAPAYAVGAKGLGTYGSTGPVLFNPESSANQISLNYGAPASGHSYEGAAFPLGDSGHSFSGFSLGAPGQSLGGSLKGISNYTPGKSNFKPSTFLGASVQSDAGHGVSGLTASYAAPSFANYQAATGGHGPSFSSAGHGLSFGSLSSYTGGSPKHISPTYLPSKSEGYGSLESIASAFSASGQIASPPGTTYGSPSTAYLSNNVHAASAPSPAYYVTSQKHSSPSFGSGSSFSRGPASAHSHSSFSSGPKHSFGGHGGSSRYAHPKDIQGSYSETSYNTIKYSEELKPRYN